MISYQGLIIVIAGPTGSGKSSLAVDLAKEINGYIINADSRQVYKELKIGTAQPVPDRVDGEVWYVDGIKHYLYGQVSIKDSYNISQYQKDVQRVLDINPTQTAILVGGTGLYIDSVVYSYDLQNVSSDNEYSREQLDSMNVKELQSLIPENTLRELNSSDVKNPRRLIRAIEKGSSYHKKGAPLNFKYFVLDIDIETLKSQINRRLEQMFNLGLEQENRELLEKGYTYEMPALNSIGYYEFKGYFTQEKSLEEVKKEILLHTIQYSKHQRTWFKRNLEIEYIKPSPASLKTQLPF